MSGLGVRVRVGLKHDVEDEDDVDERVGVLGEYDLVAHLSGVITR